MSEKFTEKVKFNVEHATVRFYLGVTGILALTAARGTDGARDSLPEPFDVMDHIGNVNFSAHTGYLAGLLIGGAVARIGNRADTPPSQGKIRAAMAAGGLVVGAVMNGLVETKTGMRLINWENTADPIDFAYGVTAATVAAATGPRVRPRDEIVEQPSSTQPPLPDTRS